MTDEALSALAGALRPFADEAMAFEDDVGDSQPLFACNEDGDLEDIAIAIGDLRRARTAYESLPAIIARVAKAEERVKELEGALRRIYHARLLCNIVSIARAVLEKG